VSLHTSRDRIAAIVARAQREHPYEVPGVSARPIIDGNPGLPGMDDGGDRPHRRASASAGPMTQRPGKQAKPRPAARKTTAADRSTSVLSSIG
jgi:hypothetical protein